MKTDQTAPGTIVVGVDGSSHARRALVWAAEQARLEGRALTVVHSASVAAAPVVRTGYPGAVLQTAPGPLDQARGIVRDAVAMVNEARPGLEVTGITRTGDPRQQLLELSTDAHLLVVGSRGRGTLAGLLLGSVSATVAKHAKCPTVVTRPGPYGVVTDGVLVGADGTAESLPVIEFAFHQASLRQVPLTVLHTSFDLTAAVATLTQTSQQTPDSLRMLLSESVAGLAEKFPDVHVSLELGYGLADECLTRGRRPRDLIVVGRRPVSMLSGLLTSSVSTSVLERSDSPVAVVPEAGPARRR